jgi:hypothetical protein
MHAPIGNPAGNMLESRHVVRPSVCRKLVTVAFVPCPVTKMPAMYWPSHLFAPELRTLELQLFPVHTSVMSRVHGVGGVAAAIAGIARSKTSAEILSNRYMDKAS